MAETIFHNTEDERTNGASNKFWSYELDGTSITVRWGRVGASSPRSKVHSFDSSHERDKFITKLVAEKIRNGYKEVTQEKLKDEIETAKELGIWNKISKMIFVAKNSDSELSKLDQYDPAQYILVEILNSRSKDITRLLLSKTETWLIQGGITLFEQTIGVNGMQKLPYDHSFSSAVRNHLKRLSKKIVEVLKTVGFAAVGVRNLFDDEAEASTPAQINFKSAMSQVDTTGFDGSVIVTFAAMGVRALEL